jgi:hypothetical protein
LTNNESKESGVNDITIFYRSKLSFDYELSVETLEIGNSAVIRSNKGSESECVLVGSHILNKMAKIGELGTFMSKTGCAAIFGDTNLNSENTTSKIFDIVISNSSVTDSLTLTSSNSANNVMFDKLLVRKA